MRSPMEILRFQQIPLHGSIARGHRRRRVPPRQKRASAKTLLVQRLRAGGCPIRPRPRVSEHPRQRSTRGKDQRKASRSPRPSLERRAIPATPKPTPHTSLPTFHSPPTQDTLHTSHPIPHTTHFNHTEPLDQNNSEAFLRASTLCSLCEGARSC